MYMYVCVYIYIYVFHVHILLIAGDFLRRGWFSSTFLEFPAFVFTFVHFPDTPGPPIKSFPIKSP